MNVIFIKRTKQNGTRIVEKNVIFLETYNFAPEMKKTGLKIAHLYVA